MNDFLYALTELVREDDHLQRWAVSTTCDDDQSFVNSNGVSTGRIARRVASNVTTGRARIELTKLVASGDVIKSEHSRGTMSRWLPVNFLANTKRKANPPKCSVDGVLGRGERGALGICGHSVCGDDAICGAGVEVECVHMVELCEHGKADNEMCSGCMEDAEYDDMYGGNEGVS